MWEKVCSMGFNSQPGGQSTVLTTIVPLTILFPTKSPAAQESLLLFKK